MRLVTIKLHRAFPELDRFDDQSAAAFVHAASRMSAASTAITAIACLLTLVLVVVGSFVLMVFLTGALGIRNPMMAVVILAYVVFPVLTGGVSAFIVRDLFLRSRISSLLKDQGRCRACRYELLGLPRDEAGMVRCPECGTLCPMDESFDRLTQASTGNEHLEALLAQRDARAAARAQAQAATVQADSQPADVPASTLRPALPSRDAPPPPRT